MAGVAVLLAGGFLLSSLQGSTGQDAEVGGYEAASVTPAATQLLIEALENEANYAEGVVDRVCVANVTSLSQQVVAGMNFRFSLTGSPVETATGWCDEDGTATISSFEVTIYESLSGSLEVTDIEYTGELDASSSYSGSGSSYEYYDAGYGYSSSDSSVSGSGSGSIAVGDVGYVGEEADSDSASGSVEFDAGSYSFSSSGSADNETVSAGDL